MGQTLLYCAARPDVHVIRILLKFEADRATNTHVVL